jgi:teichuronic acid biosynthesis glycosyltransferase TuaC
MSRRVLVLPSWYPSNAEPLTGSFFQEQNRVLAREWDVRVVVPLAQATREYWRKEPLPPDQLPLQEPPTFAVRFRTDRWMSWSRRQDSIVRAVLRLISGFAREGWAPDVLLAHSTAWAGMLATRIGTRLGLPVVIVEHSSSWFANELTAEQESSVCRALADATTVCAVSPILRRLMLARDLPDTIHWEIVGNLVDESVFYPRETSRSDTEGGFSILTVSSRIFVKDIRTLFRAVATVRARRPSLLFTVRAVGDFRGQGRTFSELAADCGVEDLVSVVDVLERAEIAEAMRDSHLFVSSSIVETFGVAIAEALACGLSVVATRSGGAEYVLGDDSPFLVEPRDPEALALKILEVLDGVHPFDPIRASESVIRRFGTTAFEARMSRILTEAIMRNKPDAAVASRDGER